MSATTPRGNGSARRSKRMSTSRVQKRAHAMLTTAGYHWVKTDSHEHNHYHNATRQIVIVPSSPRSESAELAKVERYIRSHDRERQALNTQTKVTLVDQLVAMGDAFLTNHEDQSQHAVSARLSALAAWARRACEKHGPIPTADMTSAAERLGYTERQIRGSRDTAGLASYKPGGHGVGWMVALPEQVPESYKTRTTKPKSGVIVEQPEPATDRDGTRPDIGAALVAPHAFPLNGKPEQTDAQAAFLMMAETLGLQLPGAEMKVSLERVRTSLQAALQSVEQALETLS